MNQGHQNNNERYSLRGTAAGALKSSSMRYLDETREVPIEIKDVSASGAGFLLNEAPRLSATVILSLRDEHRDFKMRAAMRWTRSVSDGVWRVGCRFMGLCDEELPGCNTMPERRATDVDVEISRQLCAEERVFGRIVNLSDGGICLQAASQFTIGENLLVQWETDSGSMQFVVKVHWARLDGDGFMTGCRFVSSVDMERIEEAISRGRLSLAAPVPDSSASPVSVPEVPESSSGSPEDIDSLDVPASSAGRPQPTGLSETGLEEIGLNRAASGLQRVTETAPPGTWAACLLVFGWTALNLAGFWPPGI